MPVPPSSELKFEIGHVERAIIEHFVVHARSKCSNIAELAHTAYVRPYFYLPSDPAPTRAQLVAVTRALKRLQAKGYPLHLTRIYLSGRPMLVLWQGKQFRKADPTRYLEELKQQKR
jgi:hypothetical protein